MESLEKGTRWGTAELRLSLPLRCTFYISGQTVVCSGGYMF
ncbi:MAG TPA: hypothetical protein VFI55_07155 [Mycobacterium sp.]|nr:hypothetical protein [Mycobacterium sp.]